MTEATKQKERYSTLARLLEDPADDPARLHPVRAPAVCASLVSHEGKVKPALLLSDGTLVVIGVRQMLVLEDTFAAWRPLFTGTPYESAPTSQSLAT